MYRELYLCKNSCIQSDNYPGLYFESANSLRSITEVCCQLAPRHQKTFISRLTLQTQLGNNAE